MVDLYSFVEDIEFLAKNQKIQSLDDKVLAIVKQTVECALFIQEYTANGFCSEYCGSYYCGDTNVAMRSCRLRHLG
jgi:hypothetical protein